MDLLDISEIARVRRERGPDRQPNGLRLGASKGILLEYALSDFHSSLSRACTMTAAGLFVLALARLPNVLCSPMCLHTPVRRI
jgi:hypothetical protein